MNLRPLHDRLIVQRLDESAPEPGAIIVPDSAKQKPHRGRVLAAGVGIRAKGGTRIPLDVEVGDTVLFAKFSGHEINVEGVEYLIMKERDVLAVQGRTV